MVRLPAIDWARGVASLLMIQGHAWHAWVAPAVKLDTPYRLTRVVATLPLPAFLVLAGAAAAMRVRAAHARGEPARDVRKALVRRGLQVVAAGYAASAAYALIDGMDSLDTLLRADVLHVIGLSLAVLGLLVGGGTGPQATAVVVGRAVLAGAVVTGACPLVAAAWPDPPPALRPVVGLVIDVPGITLMPLVPLFAWAAFGMACGHWLATATEQTVRRSGPPDLCPPLPQRTLLTMAALGLAMAAAGNGATSALLAATGGPLTRAHGAVVPNVFEYAGRGMFVLGAAPLLVARLPRGAQTVLRQFGQASLYAYVFHIPFCYGRLGTALQDRLSMTQAAPLILLLTLMSYGVVRARLAWGNRSRLSPAH